MPDGIGITSAYSQNGFAMLMRSQDALSLTVPFFPIKPPVEPVVTQTVEIVGKLNDTGYLLFFMDNSSFRANFK